MPTAEEIKAAKEADAQRVADEAARKAAAKDQESKDAADETEEGDEPDLEFSPKQKAYVERLRKENAKTRIKAKDLETQYTGLNDRFGKLEGGLKKLFGEDDDSLPPEEKVKKLTARTEELSKQSEAMALANALKDAAIEHGVGKADYEYFEFLVGKKLNALKDGEEMSEEDLLTIAKQAKSKSSSRSTSVDGNEPDPDEDDGTVKLEDFQNMGIGEKSALYQKDKALYEKLAAADRTSKKKKV